MALVFTTFCPRGTAGLRLAACLFLAALFLCAAPTQAATISVDSGNDDTSAGDGSCTLREAIGNASSDSDTTSGDCAGAKRAATRSKSPPTSTL